MTPLVEVLTRTTDYFRGRGIGTPRLDAELLIGHLLGLDRVKVYLNFDRPMTAGELEGLRVLVRRRGGREPLAWILGEKEFFGRDFRVGAGILVPRPDTETLVEVALTMISDVDPTYVADVGSGSGCVGLTLALERPGVRLYAIDVSDEALACTKANVEKHNLAPRVGVLRGHLLSPVPPARHVDWVVSNPPYIPSGDLAGLEPEVRDHEPRLALDGGSDGLDLYRALIPAAAARARAGVIVEVGKGQAEAVAGLMQGAGLTPEMHPDLAGVLRVVSGRMDGGNPPR